MRLGLLVAYSDIGDGKRWDVPAILMGRFRSLERDRDMVW